jgi:hypothetical protein
MTAHELLTGLQREGFRLTALPGEKLEVRPASRLTNALREELKRRKTEVLTLLTQQQRSPWLCEHCGNPAEIEAVEPSLDNTRMLTYWQCESCQIWGVTPNTLRDLPVWVSSKVQ